MANKYEYFEKSIFRNATVYSFVLLTMIWLPLALMFFYMAQLSNQWHVYLIFISLLILLMLKLIQYSQEKAKFATLEISADHIISNLLMGKRRVFNIDKVEGVKFYKHILYFRHLGWPVLIVLPKVSEQEKLTIITLLTKPSMA